MSWSAIEEKHRKKYHRDTIAPENDDERKFIEYTIKEEFPDLKSEEIKKAVARCSKIIPAPRESSMFFGVLYSLLSK